MLDLAMGALRLVFGLAVLLLLLYVPGVVTVNAVARRRFAPHIFLGTTEWLSVALAVSVLVAGGLGFLLAEVGLFAWWSVLLLAVIYSTGAAALSGVHFRRRELLTLLRVPAPYPQRAAELRLARIQRGILFFLLLLGAVLFSRPAEMLRGALDSGVYVNDGVALGRSGSIFQRDSIMRQLNDDAGEGRELLQGLNPDRYVLARNRMPGFYVYDKKAALVVPQHYFLYPTWIGLLYTLFGIWGALYATPLLALLFVGAVYTFARRAFSGGAALLALGLLILCPVMIWFARYPVSEVITGLLAFIGFFAFMRMVQLAGGRERAPSEQEVEPGFEQAESPTETWASFFGVVSAVALGQIALARPDFIFYLAPVPIYLLYWRLSRNWQRAYTWFAGGLAAMLGLFAIHYFIYSYPYTLDLYHNVLIDVRRDWRPLLLALYAGVLALVLLDRLFPRLRPLWRRGASWAVRYRWVWAGIIIAVLGLYVLYHYAVDPWLPNRRVDRGGRPIPQAYVTTLASYIGAQVDQGSRYNLLRIGWYLSPFGILLGTVGLARWVWDRLDAAKGLFFGSLLVTSLIFIQETYTDAHYIYTMRRYVPLILPALILGFAWLCRWLWSSVRPRLLGQVLAGVLVVALALFFVYTDRVIVGHVEESGALAQLQSLAGKFDSKSIVLFSNERDEPYVVATPLQYVFGVESFVLTHAYPDVNNKALAGAVDRWRKDGYRVFAVLGANGGKLDLPGYTLKQQGDWTYDVPELEQLYYQKPLNISRATLPWGIYSVEPTSGAAQATFPVKQDIGENDYSALMAGFYVQEKAEGDDNFWRWTGDHAVMRLPWPTAPDGTLRPGKLKISMRPESRNALTTKPVQRKDPLTVRAQVENTPIGELTLSPGSPFTEYTLNVPSGIKPASPDGTALVDVFAPTWSPQSAGVSDDARALGVQIDNVEIDTP